MRAIFFTLMVLVGTVLNAQELNFKVSVKAPTNTTTDPSILKKLETEIFNLLNDAEWTDLEYAVEERLEGNIQITITEEVSTGVFRGDLIIQGSRPVYNSNYITPLINFVDKDFQFSYDGVSPVSKTTDGFVNNLSSVLCFYVYYVLGLDADSFELNGGDKYYKVAQEIYNNLPGSIQQNDNGWSIQRNDKQNRYFMLENVKSQKLNTFRKAWYEYHRRGLDYMFSDSEKARKTILQSIQTIGEANKKYNNSILTRMFSDAKRNEIIDVFQIGNPQEKNTVKRIMLKIDPAQSTLFKRLK